MKKQLLLFFICILSAHGFAQWNLSGDVMDKDGKPVIGAAVQENNNFLNGTVTDINGRFSLILTDTAQSIKISYVGFKALDVPVTRGLNEISIESIWQCTHHPVG